jgi:hypothetical protein
VIVVAAASAQRAEALGLLWDILRRTLDERDHEAIRVWIKARSTEHGGFLWLTGRLHARPSAIETAVYGILNAPPARRLRLKKRIERTLKVAYGLDA